MPNADNQHYARRIPLLAAILAAAALLAPTPPATVAAPLDPATTFPASHNAPYGTPPDIAARQHPRRVTIIGTPNLKAANPPCALAVYSSTGWGGDEIILYIVGQWVNWADYGLHYVRSFWLRSCGPAHLAQGRWGAGPWWPGNTAPWSSNPNIGAGYSGSGYQ